MAFIASLASATVSHPPQQPSKCTQTRREMLQFALGVTVSGVLLPPPAQTLAETPSLPNGAKQFTQIISAQRQWTSLRNAFANGHVPDDEEWNNIRTYLRAVFGVSADMEFLARTWNGKRRDEGLATIKVFRKSIKALDKPAIKRDIDTFLKGHADVEKLFVDYFELLKEDSVGDMPDEL